MWSSARRPSAGTSSTCTTGSTTPDDEKGWPDHGPKDPADYADSFVDNPFPTEEWCYYLGDRLVGVGYVDVLPDGLSAIYFFYDPDERDRSLGTFNVCR